MGSRRFEPLTSAMPRHAFWEKSIAKNDVDLMHYNCQSEEDLKKIYDRVMADVEMRSVK